MSWIDDRKIQTTIPRLQPQKATSGGDVLTIGMNFLIH